MAMHTFMIVVLMMLLACGEVAALHSEGTLKGTYDGWHTFGVMCFDKVTDDDPKSGTVEVIISYPDAPADDIPEVTMYLYSDEDYSWPTIWSDSTASYTVPCEDRLPIPPTKMATAAVWDSAQSWTTTFSVTQHTRPRFWYVSAANCESLDGLHFEITMLNDGIRGSWYEQFGTDMQGLLDLYVLMFLCYLVYGAFMVVALRRLKAEFYLLHSLVRLFVLSVILQAISVFFYFIHFVKYKDDGEGSLFSYWTAALFTLGGRNVFLLMLLLISRGWTISVHTLTGQRVIVGVIGVNALLDTILLIWEAAVWTHEMIVPPMFCRVFLYLSQTVYVCYCIYFAYGIYISRGQEPNGSKRLFYAFLGVFYTIWIMSLGLINMLALALDPWVRTYTIAIVDECVTFMGYVAFSYLIWPSHAKHFFQIAPPSVMDAPRFRDTIGTEASSIITGTHSYNAVQSDDIHGL